MNIFELQVWAENQEPELSLLFLSEEEMHTAIAEFTAKFPQLEFRGVARRVRSLSLDREELLKLTKPFADAVDIAAYNREQEEIGRHASW